MDTPWIVGVVAFIVFFVVFEGYAMRHPDRQNTLSRAVYDLGSSFPLSICLIGMLVGGLAVHFYWHWCPPGSNSFGMLLGLFNLG